jgi:hypothetical protein
MRPTYLGVYLGYRSLELFQSSTTKVDTNTNPSKAHCVGTCLSSPSLGPHLIGLGLHPQTKSPSLPPQRQVVEMSFLLTITARILQREVSHPVVSLPLPVGSTNT